MFLTKQIQSLQLGCRHPGENVTGSRHKKYAYFLWKSKVYKFQYQHTFPKVTFFCCMIMLKNYVKTNINTDDDSEYDQISL